MRRGPAVVAAAAAAVASVSVMFFVKEEREAGYVSEVFANESL